MAKKKKRSAIDSRQLSLFEALLKLQEDHHEEEKYPQGSLNMESRLRNSLSKAIKGCPLSRWEIAGKMSALMDQEITRCQLDSWLAESKSGHRFPAEYLPSFCIATECNEPLRVLAEAAGIFALPGPEALRAEIQKLDEQAKRLQGEKRKRMLFLKEMEEKL